MTEPNAPYVDRPMREYLDESASNAPTPGGGSVSALAAALGCTMASMAANFTTGRKKFAEVEGEVKDCLAKLDEAHAKLLDQMQRDTEAYAGVGAAYGMPRSTDDDKAARAEAIQSALQAAMQPPLETMRAALDALRATRALLGFANPNLITDVGVAAIFLEAAMRGAYLNVAINLKSIKNEMLVAKTREETAAALDEARTLECEVAEGVAAKLA